MSVDEIYQATIKPLPVAERLAIAAMILNDLPPGSVVDVSDAWTEDDLRDFSAASLGRLKETPEEATHD